MPSTHVHLQPALPPSATLRSAWNPSSNELALVPAPTDAFTTKSIPIKQGSTQQQIIYYAQQSDARDAVESRAFIVETYTLFASLQKIAAEEQVAAQSNLYGISSSATSAGPLRPSTLQYYNRICRLYREAIVKQLSLIQSDTQLEASQRDRQLAHYTTLHSTLSLAEILYLPSDGVGAGVVGEELLDWVNTVDRAPTAAEGEELADLSRPWEHPNFWNYIYRCILRAHLVSASALLSLITSHHPSPWLREISNLCVSLIETYPRSTAYTSELTFLASLRRWRVKAFRASTTHEQMFNSSAPSDPKLGGEENEDERDDWFAGFNVLLALLNGKEGTILDSSEDWREALAAWGLWVNPSIRRDGLPATLDSIRTTHPVDETLVEEAIQAALIQGDVTKALQKANGIGSSTWLVAHLADVLDKVGVVDQPSDRETYPTPLRDWFVMTYAEELYAADSSLWRIVVEYLAAGCGEEGKAKMRSVLRSVDLTVEGEEKEATEAVETEEEEQSEVKKNLVEDVLSVCAEHGLEDEVVAICKTYSEHLIAQQRYGPALSFCIRSGDLKRIARIADRILDEYLTNGQEAFITHVDSIPTSLLRPSRSPLAGDLFHDDGDTMSDDEEEMPLAPYSTRLSFLARYRDFFALYARGDRQQAASLLVLLLTSNVAPKSFYAVMLLDAVPLLQSDQLLVTTEETYELLRCLEEIVGPIVATEGEDVYGYLDALGKLMNAGVAAGDDVERMEMTRKGLKQLDVVRDALARYLARCYCLP